MSTRQQTVQQISASLPTFAESAAGITLRPYQIEAGQAVLDSISSNAGRSIVIMFARQSGKDELCANLKAYLLARFADTEVGIVEVNPTYKPQTINAIDRLEARLSANRLTHRYWRKHSDFMRLFGKAKVSFLSGDGSANVVGAVASLLLIVNEAQAIEPAIYDKNFAPMAASTNATRLFLGTAWTSHTLLARELRSAQQAEQQDGIRRAFLYDADDVRKVLPAYGEYVDGEIARLGREHALVRTQYFNEEIDAQAGMFNETDRALMKGDQDAEEGPIPGEIYVFSLDIAGQTPSLPPPNAREEIFWRSELPGHLGEVARPSKNKGLSDGGGGRDSTTLSIARVDIRESGSVIRASYDSRLSTHDSQLPNFPIYRIIHRRSWTGFNHLLLFGQLKALADVWKPQHIVIDATGVGEGLWAMLDKAYPTRVIPVKFSAQKKSEIGYRYLSMIETGRVRDCSETRPLRPFGVLRDPPFSAAGERSDDLKVCKAENGGGRVGAVDVDRQYTACTSEVLTGPQKTLRWGVPDGTRDENGQLIHDDIVIADALLTEADALDWSYHSPALIVQAKDPLDEMSRIR